MEIRPAFFPPAAGDDAFPLHAISGCYKARRLAEKVKTLRGKIEPIVAPWAQAAGSQTMSNWPLPAC
jgi:hypothetical protein